MLLIAILSTLCLTMMAAPVITPGKRRQDVNILDDGHPQTVRLRRISSTDGTHSVVVNFTEEDMDPWRARGYEVLTHEQWIAEGRKQAEAKAKAEADAEAKAKAEAAEKAEDDALWQKFKEEQRAKAKAGKGDAK